LLCIAIFDEPEVSCKQETDGADCGVVGHSEVKRSTAAAEGDDAKAL
jgi:hypothetical protein